MPSSIIWNMSLSMLLLVFFNFCRFYDFYLWSSKKKLVFEKTDLLKIFQDHLLFNIIEFVFKSSFHGHDDGGIVVCGTIIAQLSDLMSMARVPSVEKSSALRFVDSFRKKMTTVVLGAQTIISLLPMHSSEGRIIGSLVSECLPLVKVLSVELGLVLTSFSEDDMRILSLAVLLTPLYWCSIIFGDMHPSLNHCSLTFNVIICFFCIDS